MRKEYDFSKGERGKFWRRYARAEMKRLGKPVPWGVKLIQREMAKAIVSAYEIGYVSGEVGAGLFRTRHENPTQGARLRPRTRQSTRGGKGARRSR